MVFFEMPQIPAAEDNPVNAIVDAIGIVFEQVNALFQQEPERFDSLISGAVLVPLYAAEQADTGEERERLLTLLFDNLEYPFSRQQFDAYLARKGSLPAYAKQIHPSLREDTFWNEIGRSASPEQGNRILSAFAEVLAAFAVKNPDAVCREVVAACNYSRLQQACAAADGVEQSAAGLLQCYREIMRHSGEIQPEEQEFLVQCLLLYSLHEIGCLGTVSRLDISWVLSAGDLQNMLSESDQREELARLFVCSDTHAGQFWKVVYTAAGQGRDDMRTAELALWLERLLKSAAETPEQQQKAQRHRDTLFALVV